MNLLIGRTIRDILNVESAISKHSLLVQSLEEDNYSNGLVIKEGNNSVKDNIPNVMGIYFFYSKDDELLYVGKCNDLKRRIPQSLRDRNVSINLDIWSKENSVDEKFEERILYVRYLKVISKDELDITEASIISKLQPKLNSDFKNSKKVNPNFILDESLVSDKVFLKYGSIKTADSKIRKLRALEEEYQILKYYKNAIERDRYENTIKQIEKIKGFELPIELLII